MHKIIEVEIVSPYLLKCRFNSGEVKTIDVYPVIQNHIYINGVSDILKEEIFKTVKIGQFGELLWSHIVKEENSDTYFDYDISPDFVFENSKN